MTAFSYVIHYVADPAASARFYADLIGAPILEGSPTFAMVPLREGIILGFWRNDAVIPPTSATPGAGEIAFAVADEATVRAKAAEWAARGITIAQAPTVMDFGPTFVALDPDGHRIRVLTARQG